MIELHGSARTLPWGPVDHGGLAPLAGGVTAVAGIRAGGVGAGLKDRGGLDLALVDAGRPVVAAATTTTNLVKAAPCVVTDTHVRDGAARAVVVNAGNANACTGVRGQQDAQRVCTELAALLGCTPSEVLPLSTGIIGVPLPVDRVCRALPALVADAAGDLAAGTRAAEAITTTDTVVKQLAVEVADEQGTARVGGLAKGAGMIEPAMATMLAVVVTDAPLAAPVARRVLQQAVARTFNRISVDACGSTNDTVVLLATGLATSPPTLGALHTGVEAVCAELARSIVADGEGTTKTCAVTVRGARTGGEAESLARAVTSSALFRAAVHGADPNWGRILAAMGGAGVAFDPGRVSVSCGRVMVCRFGTATAFDRGQAAAALSGPEVTVEVDLGLGEHAATMLCADLTPQYVADNAYYTT
jgi:glutamate N-acetyltransferase / amino-acid N-acetyltransferase